MPLYDYKCKKCGHIFEVQQSMKDAPLKKCPKCAGEVHRLISAAGIVFKGSGFHVTDYGRPKTGGERPKTKDQRPKTTEHASPAGGQGTPNTGSKPEKKDAVIETKSSSASASPKSSK
jgi:putative FmdB family regulatory protein